MNKNCVTVYLAGACKYEPDEGQSWRQEAKNAFRKIDRYDALKSCVIDPTDYFTYKSPTHKTDKQVKSFYLSQIKRCDVLLVSLKNSTTSPGTAQEVQFAIDNNISVVGFDPVNSYPWLEKVDCDVVFDTLQEAIKYIKDYYMKAMQPIKQE